MNNIEKFEQIKELSRLKGEYHKRELMSLVTFEKVDTSNNLLGWISIGKLGFNIYRQIKAIIR